tara:strand:+ start:260 stop:472 length:213 start_codon:yes stop_codon:yes gene_type:complete
MTAIYDEATGMISMTFTEYTSMLKQLLEMQLRLDNSWEFSDDPECTCHYDFCSHCLTHSEAASRAFEEEE